MEPHNDESATSSVPITLATSPPTKTKIKSSANSNTNGSSTGDVGSPR